MSRVSSTDWCKNLDTILQWSPYSSEANLLEQFCLMSDQGTIIIIYNLWENENEELELDLNTDKEDIQLRGVNRDEKKIEMAIQFPNSMHFLTYKHSLRLVATVTIGFVKDAKDHIDVQGFNVYHKNRLIKPFWRVWNAAGSDGRGVIGVLEANFVEPAHDKQGFERTTVLARLEAKLVHMQKQYWSTNCHKIGYAPRRIKKFSSEFNKDRDTSPDELLLQSPRPSSRNYASPPHGPSVGKSVQSYDHLKSDNVSSVLKNTSKGKPNYLASSSSVQKTSSQYLIKRPSSSHISVSHYSPKRLDSSSSDSDSGSAPLEVHNPVGVNRTNRTSVLTRVDLKPSRALNSIPRVASLLPIVNIPTIDSQNSKQLEVDDQNIEQVVEENHILKERIKEIEESMFQALQKERDQNKLLSEKLKTAEKNLEDLNKEQESLIDIFSEERGRRDREEESLRKKLKDASALAQELKEKLDRSKKNVYRKG